MAKIIIRYAIVEERQPQEEAKNIKDAVDTFGGKIVSRWHE